VLYAHELGLVPITTPAYSPESNGLAEAFIGTFKRDYVDGAELRDAEAVLAHVGGWFEDYKHPGAALRARHAEPARLSRRDAPDGSCCRVHFAGDAAFGSGRAIV
jgi:putative transposase